MADPTKVVRFPNRKKLHLVWSSPSPEQAGEQARKPDNTPHQSGDATLPEPRQHDNGSITPEKTD